MKRETPEDIRARMLVNAMKRKPDADGYRYYSQTSSGWVNSVNIDAPKSKRWRARHEDFGEKYFDDPNKILNFTLRHVTTLAAELVKAMRTQ